MEKNLQEAERWLIKAGGAKAANALFDIYWEIGTEESYRKMIETVEPFSKTNNGAAIRLSKAYKEGKGVEKDPAKAAEVISELMSSKRSKDMSDSE